MDRRLEGRWAIARTIDVLADLLGLPATPVEPPEGVGGPDLVVEAANQLFFIETAEPTAGRILEKGRRVAEFAKGRGIPLVVVPFMGDAGKAACERAGVSWIDLSGNADIVGPGLRVLVNGRPNQFRRRGRPANIFAPKSSRITRFLLMHTRERWTQREISQATGVSEGFVSRIVARLEADRYVMRDDQGSLRVQDPNLLLEAWRERYEFSRQHSIIRGHVAARSGADLSLLVGNALEADGIPHAATGLAAAWQLTHFATFRIATFYLGREIGPSFTRKTGFREEERGANLWLVLPNDTGVFQGAEVRDGIRCVHPVQAYLDLNAHPERAAEAAERLRAEYLNW